MTYIFCSIFCPPSPEGAPGLVQVVCPLAKGPSPGHAVRPVGPKRPQAALRVSEGVQGRAHLEGERGGGRERREREMVGEGEGEREMVGEGERERDGEREMEGERGRENEME